MPRKISSATALGLAALAASVVVAAQTASFTRADYSIFDGHGHPRAIITGDFNDDGFLDIATADDERTVSLLINLADDPAGPGASFAQVFAYVTGNGPWDLVAADFNHDDRLDIAVTNADSDTVSILLGRGQGRMDGPRTFAAPGSPRGIATADLDGDGNLDLAVCNYFQNTVQVFLGDGAGGFVSRAFVAVGDKPQGIDKGDLDRNGTVDLVVANAGPFSTPISILYNEGGAAFRSTSYCCGGRQAWDVVVGDFDRNGWLDFAYVRSVTEINRVYVYRFGPNGSINGQGLRAGEQPRGLAFSDFNGDGWLDLVVANRGSNTLSLYRGQSDGWLASDPETIAAGSGSRAVAAGDFNFDGRPDAATANQYAGSVSVLTDRATFPRAGEIVRYAEDATRMAGGWRLVFDPAAASSHRAFHPDAGAPKQVAALAKPMHYFEFVVRGEANTPYRLWLRGKAQNDHSGNDSAHVQFSDSVDAAGTPIWRTGTTSSTEVNLEECSGCGLRGWGWQDNGWGAPGLLGPVVRFATSGAHRVRVQTREDGFSIDQLVLSSGTYLDSPPGPAKDDDTIVHR